MFDKRYSGFDFSLFPAGAVYLRLHLGSQLFQGFLIPIKL
jgi:hypothetical protein